MAGYLACHPGFAKCNCGEAGRWRGGFSAGGGVPGDSGPAEAGWD